MASSIGPCGYRNSHLTIERNAFEQFMNAFNFPKQFAQALSANNGSFASFVDYEKVEETITPAFLCRYTFPDNTLSSLALLVQILTHFLD